MEYKYTNIYILSIFKYRMFIRVVGKQIFIKSHTFEKFNIFPLSCQTIKWENTGKNSD